MVTCSGYKLGAEQSKWASKCSSLSNVPLPSSDNGVIIKMITMITDKSYKGYKERVNVLKLQMSHLPNSWHDKGLPNDDKRQGEEDDDVVASMLFIIGNRTIKIWAKTNSIYDGSVE